MTSDTVHTGLSPSEQGEAGGAPDKFAMLGLTFDDVLLLPAESDVIPSGVDTSTNLTRNIRLNIPLVSAAMDTVTEARMAIAMARQGGLGVLQRNLPIEEQAQAVEVVKRSESGMVTDPVTCSPDDTLAEVDELCARFRISGVPVTDASGTLVGIITNRDMRFEVDYSKPVREVMTKSPLVTAQVGVTADAALGLLRDHKVEKLPIVDGDGKLRGLITVKDFVKTEQYPHATKDADGRLLVGAAVGVGEDGLQAGHGAGGRRRRRAHGRHRARTFAARSWRWSPGCRTTSATRSTSSAATSPPGRARRRSSTRAPTPSRSASGPGSICTTRVVTGIGVPQVTAIYEAAKACRPAGVPVIGDGGLQYSGDIAKAIAVGCRHGDAGRRCWPVVAESPGELIFVAGKQYKTYRGMGSLGAMQSRGEARSYSKDRYSPGRRALRRQARARGHRGPGAVPWPAGRVAHQLVGGLRAAMGYTGAATIDELKDAKLIRITSAGLQANRTRTTSPSPSERRTTSTADRSAAGRAASPLAGCSLPHDRIA